MHEMLMQLKTPSQGKPIESEGSTRHTPSLQIIKSLFTSKWILGNEQEETNMDEVLQEYMDKRNSFKEIVTFHTYRDTQTKELEIPKTFRW